MPLIKTDLELDLKLEQICNMYRGVRHQFVKTTLNEDGVSRLIRFQGRIVHTITEALAEIEEYTGAADIRRMYKQLQEIEEKRTSAEKV